MNLSNNKILITGGASGIGLGLTELAFGFSEIMAKATPEELKATFNRMNS